MLKVTIVGPDAKYPARKSVKIGDVVTFQKDTSSPYPNVTKALLGGAEIGNVADSSHTVQKGTKSSSEIYDIMPDEFEGVVIQFADITFSGGQKSLGLIVEIDEKKEEKKSETKGGKTVMNTKALQTLVEGPKKFHPHKYLVAPALKDGKEVPVTLTIEGDQVKVMFESEGKIESCGMVQEKGNDTFVGAPELISAFDKYKGADGTVEYEAKLIRFEESIRYVLQVDFKGETALEAVVNDVVRKGIMTEDELKKRVAWIDKFALNEKNKMEIFKNMKKHNDLSRIPHGDFKFINSNSIAELSIASYNARLNVLLEGPKASGKNTLIEDIGRLYHVPVYEIQINAQTDNETLLGSKTLRAKDSAANKDEINKCIAGIIASMSGDDTMLASLAKSLMKELVEGTEAEATEKLSTAQVLFGMDFTPLVEALRSGQTEVEFQPSVLIKAMEEGGVIVFDEINTGHPSVLALLNSILDDRRRIQVPAYGLVKAHPNFRAFATMNKDYQGTFELNEATASRFTPIVFEEPASIKDIIKKNVPSVDKQTLNACDKLYENIRKETKSGKMQSQAINIRAFIHACIQVEWGIPLKTALINNVANSCPDIDDRTAIKSLIDLAF